MTQINRFEQAGIDGGVYESGGQTPAVARTPSLGLPGISFYAVAKDGVEHPDRGSTYTLITARSDSTTSMITDIPVVSAFDTWK